MHACRHVLILCQPLQLGGYYIINFSVYKYLSIVGVMGYDASQGRRHSQFCTESESQRSKQLRL